MQEKKFLTVLKADYLQQKNLDIISTPEPAAEPTPEVAAEQTPKPAIKATPTKRNKSRLKLQQEFMKEIIADKKDINNETFKLFSVSESNIFSKRLN